MSTNVRDYAAERYNRRTRAIERQAEAMTRIAEALEVQALTAALGTPVQMVNNTRVWREEFAAKQQERLSAWVKELRR